MRGKPAQPRKVELLLMLALQQRQSGLKVMHIEAWILIVCNEDVEWERVFKLRVAYFCMKPPTNASFRLMQLKLVVGQWCIGLVGRFFFFCSILNV